ncbi:MAG: T9SS type A sorting domain-containing protein [Microbacter sp.]
MKKCTLFAIALFAFMAVHAQTNLLTNPSFETWTNGLPGGWTFPSTIPSTNTVTQNTTNTYNNSGSALQVASTSTAATFSVNQYVLPPNGISTFDTNTTYELRIRYTATAGDGTDARIWCGYLSNAPGTTPNTYITFSHADSIGLLGPGGNFNPTGYASNNGYLYSTCPGSPVYANQWYTYVYKFNFPAGVKQFNFQIRMYKGSTVLWDDFYFGEAVSTDFTTAVQNTSTSNLKVFVVGNQLEVQGVEANTPVMVYNTLGALVKNGVASDHVTLPKGVYIVKVSGNTTKVFVN